MIIDNGFKLGSLVSKKYTGLKTSDDVDWAIIDFCVINNVVLSQEDLAIAVKIVAFDYKVFIPTKDQLKKAINRISLKQVA